MLGMKCAGCEAKDSEIAHLRSLVDDQAKNLLALTDAAAYQRRHPTPRSPDTGAPVRVVPVTPQQLRNMVYRPAPDGIDVRGPKSEAEVAASFKAPDNFMA